MANVHINKDKLANNGKTMCEDISETYWETLSDAVTNVNAYVSHLIANLMSSNAKKYQYGKEKLFFLDNFYDNKPKDFENFLQQINRDTNGKPKDLIEQKMKEIWGYNPEPIVL